MADFNDSSKLNIFLDQYESMISDRNYRDFSFAEDVANDMALFFNSKNIPAIIKARALGIAIDISESANRYAAMDTCKRMVIGIIEESIALEVLAILPEYRGSFIEDVVPINCKNNTVANYFEVIQNQ